jgi:hypothetical protein
MIPLAQSNFQDVDKNQWYYSSISSGVQNGVIKGYNNQIFGVGDFVTRQDAATILANCLIKTRKLNYPSNPENIVSVYTDKDSISTYAIPSVAMLKVANIMRGYSPGNFSPQENITKAQTSTIIFLALRIYSSQGLPAVLFEDLVDIS